MEKGDRRRLILPTLKIWVNNVAGNGAAREGASEIGVDAFLQKRGKGDFLKIANGQALLRECGC